MDKAPESVYTLEVNNAYKNGRCETIWFQTLCIMSKLKLLPRKTVHRKEGQMGGWAAGLFVGWLRYIPAKYYCISDKCTCCHVETEVAD